MTTRPTELREQDKEVAVTRLMAGAQAHQRASVYCMDNPDAKPPNIDWLYFNVVSFELILMSIEQSLRLQILLHYGIISGNTSHALHVLYNTILRKSGGESGIRSQIVATANTYARTQRFLEMDEKEIRACLRKHDSSYANFRHFQLKKNGELNQDFEFTFRELQVLHCLALGLIRLNMIEIKRRKLQVFSSMSSILESKMVADMNAMKKSISE